MIATIVDWNVVFEIGHFMITLSSPRPENNSHKRYPLFEDKETYVGARSGRFPGSVGCHIDFWNFVSVFPLVLDRSLRQPPKLPNTFLNELHNDSAQNHPSEALKELNSQIFINCPTISRVSLPFHQANLRIFRASLFG